MIAYVGYQGLRANVARTHASVATAAAALARTGGDMLAAITLLTQAAEIRPPMRLFNLDGARVPKLPADAHLAVMADLETYRLEFFTCGAWSTTVSTWWSIGGLDPRFALGDVESIETNLILTAHPSRRVVDRRRVSLVRP